MREMQKRWEKRRYASPLLHPLTAAQQGLAKPLHGGGGTVKGVGKNWCTESAEERGGGRLARGLGSDSCLEHAALRGKISWP